MQNIKCKECKKIKKTSRSTPIIIALVFAIMICVIIGITYCNKSYSSEVIDFKCTKKENIISYRISHNDKDIDIESSAFSKLYSHIAMIKPTRKKEANADKPQAENYYSIVVFEEAGGCFFWIYEKNKKTYLEIPYNGIFEIEKEAFNILEKERGRNEKKK